MTLSTLGSLKILKEQQRKGKKKKKQYLKATEVLCMLLYRLHIVQWSTVVVHNFDLPIRQLIKLVNKLVKPSAILNHCFLFRLFLSDSKENLFMGFLLWDLMPFHSPFV